MTIVFKITAPDGTVHVARTRKAAAMVIKKLKREFKGEIEIRADLVRDSG